MKIYNFTQHTLTEEQKRDGLVELPEATQRRVKELLNFDTLPKPEEVQRRAEELAALAADAGAKGIMLGGAPFLMAMLTTSMKILGIRTYFAFSRRRSVEVHTNENVVEKRCLFCYEGLIEV